jgi:hypothetical protein
VQQCGRHRHGNLSRELLDALHIWARFLYAPLLEHKARPIMEGDSGFHGTRVAHRVHVELRHLGGVKPPREFVLMARRQASPLEAAGLDSPG